VRTPSTLLAAFTLCAVAICGACGASGQESNGSTSAGDQALAEDAGPVAQTMNFGAPYRFPDGVTVVISAPRPFHPSDSAYPRSNRAVAFEIGVRNDGDQPYHLSGLSVSATVEGAVAKQVVDSMQGYSGIVDADKHVQPGRDTGVTLAFAVPDEPHPIRLTVRTGEAGPVVAVYSGSA
jgi:hypothetical protein